MNLIQKITPKYKFNDLYNRLQEECFKINQDLMNHKISEASAICSYKGIVRYATIRYKHICATYAVEDTDIKKNDRFAEMIGDIENAVDNLQEISRVK